MAFDVTRRGETLLVTSMCLQRLKTSQYNKKLYLKKIRQLLGMGMTAHPPLILLLCCCGCIGGVRFVVSRCCDVALRSSLVVMEVVG